MQKQEKIIKMFDQIAPTYDLANRAISFGVDVSWRKKAVKLTLEKLKGKLVSIADVACGTGDMISSWCDGATQHGVQIERIVGIDPSEGMLEVARQKFPSCEFIKATAGATTLDDASVDILSISYGIRNVVELDAALAEFNRIIKPGGGLAFKIRDFYVSKILPKIGAFISKNKEAYEYLPSSIGSFLDAASFSEKLKNAGFELRVQKGFSFDVSTLFIAEKIARKSDDA